MARRRRDCSTPLDSVRCNSSGRVRAFVECDGTIVWRTEPEGAVVSAASALADYLPCTAACDDCPPTTAQAVQVVGQAWTLHDDNNDQYPQRASTTLESGETVEATFFSTPYTSSYPPAFGRTRNDANPFHNVVRCGNRRTLGIARGGPDAIWGVRFTFSSGVTPYPLAITLVDFDGSAERWRSNFGDPTIMPANAELQPPVGAASANPANWIASTVNSPVAQTFVWSDCRTQPPPGGVVEFEIHDRNPAIMNTAIVFCPFDAVNCAGEPVT